MGPGENAGVVDVGDGLAVGVQGRVAQPSERGRAVPGRGHRGRRHPARHLRGGRPADRGARLAALRRARLAAFALPVRLGGEGHRPLRQLDRRADRGRRGLLRAGLRAELPRERDVRGAGAARAPDPERRGRGGEPARAARRAHRSRRDRRRVGARERGAVRGGLVQAPDGADRRPVRGVEARRVLPRAAGARAARSLQDLGAAGLSSSSSEMASKGEVGLDIDVSRVPLREADMEPFEIMISESQERMLCVVEPARLDEVLELCERWEVRATGDRRGHGHAAAARVRRRRAGRRHAGRGARGRLPLYDLEPEEPASRSTRTRPRARWRCVRRGDAARAARLLEHRLEAIRLRAVRLDRRARARCGGRSQPTPRCSCSSRTAAPARSRSRSTATAAAWPCDPYIGAVEAVLECARNLAAWARSRSASRTASTSATPRSRTSRGSSRARSRACATPASRSACRWWAATSRSTTRAAAGRSTRRRSSGMVGKLAEPAACPAPGSPRRATRSRSSGMFEPALEGSELEKLRGRLGRELPPLDLAAHADALVRVRAAVRGGGLPDRPRLLRGRARVRARRVLHRGRASARV